ncbi:hypothetical protein CMI42_02010 [Candidatus Pacearchaeota archaeon]|nr:hypothetical protein [Candidatus Pacearchaeota archaeon]|tara:strand:- start:1111 stop:1716 length:606 start_codon:yes stop_codon:yes gene_type:complete
MGRDNKRRRKVLKKGAKSLMERRNEHLIKAPKMRTPESRGYALKEAEIYEKQSILKSEKARKLERRKNSVIKRRASFVILVNKKGEYLFYLRDNKDSISAPNTWALIGGAAENGESAEEAVIRETKEEIGLDLDKIEFIESYELRECLVSIFKGKIDMRIEEIDLTEGRRVEYFDFDEVLKKDIADPLKTFLIENRKKIVG